MRLKHLVPNPANIFGKKDRMLGVARKKREYDIPLHKKMGSEFLMLLIGLMTFLAILALTGSMLLTDLTNRWTTGLQSKMTVEIPAETDKGEILTLDEITSLAEKLAAEISTIPYVQSARALNKSEIKNLLSPWLGDNVDYRNIPLPGLIAVEIAPSAPENLTTLEDVLEAGAPWASLNTHNKWLEDITSLAGSLRSLALLITLVIALTTFAAVAAAIRSRIATHYEELELLHLMGASDGYISRQFQKHAFFIALKGSVGGLIAAFLLTRGLGWLTSDMKGAVLPHLSLDLYDYITLITVPFLIGLIAIFTARRITLKELGRMA